MKKLVKFISLAFCMLVAFSLSACDEGNIETYWMTRAEISDSLGNVYEFGYSETGEFLGNSKDIVLTQQEYDDFSVEGDIFRKLYSVENNEFLFERDSILFQTNIIKEYIAVGSYKWVLRFSSYTINWFPDPQKKIQYTTEEFDCVLNITISNPELYYYYGEEHLAIPQILPGKKQVFEFKPKLITYYKISGINENLKVKYFYDYTGAKYGEDDFLSKGCPRDLFYGVGKCANSEKDELKVSVVDVIFIEVTNVGSTTFNSPLTMTYSEHTLQCGDNEIVNDKLAHTQVTDSTGSYVGYMTFLSFDVSDTYKYVIEVPSCARIRSVLDEDYNIISYNGNSISNDERTLTIDSEKRRIYISVFIEESADSIDVTVNTLRTVFRYTRYSKSSDVPDFVDRIIVYNDNYESCLERVDDHEGFDGWYLDEEMTIPATKESLIAYGSKYFYIYCIGLIHP